MFIIYALKLDNDDIYVGMTNNLRRRIQEHKRGKTKTTKNKKILRIIKIEECHNMQEARKKELYWKSGCGKETLKLKLWGRSSAG